jgi:hypothetical protein
MDLPGHSEKRATYMHPVQAAHCEGLGVPEDITFQLASPSLSNKREIAMIQAAEESTRPRAQRMVREVRKALDEHEKRV